MQITESGPTNRHKVLRSIQSLRAVAALLVVFFHMKLPGSAVGAAGVDLFFVISGFVMGTIGVRETPSTFMIRRIARIVPTYWLVTLALCVASALSFLHYIHFTVPELAASLLFIPYEDVSGHLWPVLIVGWTLNIEMFFYAVFAIGLVLKRPVIFTSCLLVLFVVLGAVFQPTSAPLRVWSSPLMIEFVAGLIIAAGYRVASARLGVAMMLAGVLGLIIAGVLGTGEDVRLIPWGIPAVLLVAGALSIEQAGGWPKLTPLEKVGDASFSLYLTHDVVIGMVHKVMGEGFAAVPVILVAAIALARLMYRFIEKPSMRLARLAIGR